MIFESPYPEIEIPDRPLTDHVLRRAEERPDHPALIDGPSGRTLTYGQLAEAVRRAAAGLAARGLRKGDALAIYSPNLPEYAVAFHAVASIGGVVSTANPLYTAGELKSQLTDSRARFLITVAPCLEKAAEAAEGTAVEEIFVFGEAPGATPFSALLASGDAPPEVEIDPAEDLVTRPYSSGTTGFPKGVMLTHRNLVANVEQMLAVDPDWRDEVLIGILPFFHIYGLTVLMNAALSEGATLVTLPRFDLDGFLETLAKYRVTRAHLVPPIILALAKHPAVDAHDLSALERIVSGAAPLSGELAAACAERLGCHVGQGYGLTETSPVTHYARVDDSVWCRAGTVGPPIPNTEVVIADLESGEALGPGERGEVRIRGPQVMRGYLGRPEETAASIDEDGWFKTGDVGICDPEGRLRVVDRAKELIKYKGFQVPPAELEAVLVANPAIADAAVIPIPDPESGEAPKAFVVARAPLDEQAVFDWVAERVAPYKKLRAVEFVDAIPRSAAGKILRRVLVEAERAKRAPPAAG
ncbi:MAG TPA: AMP-binding protein [Gemmatimonadota bacterium]|nr:AMP-binding protein [Gemmatimonadota bacterium]